VKGWDYVIACPFSTIGYPADWAAAPPNLVALFQFGQPLFAGGLGLGGALWRVGLPLALTFGLGLSALLVGKLVFFSASQPRFPFSRRLRAQRCGVSLLGLIGEAGGARGGSSGAFCAPEV
jgi:hypothetical protein